MDIDDESFENLLAPLQPEVNLHIFPDNLNESYDIYNPQESFEEYASSSTSSDDDNIDDSSEVHNILSEDSDNDGLERQKRQRLNWYICTDISI